MTEPDPTIDADLARRRRVIWLVAVLGALGVVAAVVVVIVINGGSSKTSAPIANNRATAHTSVLTPATTVPVKTLDTIGLGSTVALPKKVTGDPPLTANGKPELLFIGAEFCPYCAGERWALAVALSRFGTLHGVTTTQSSSTDVDPNTRTLDFLHTTYDSKYLSFVPVEAEDRNQKPLQKPTAAENALWYKYTDNKPVFPFLDFGNSYLAVGPTLDPAVLAGLTQQQIAGQLADPASAVARAIDGAANTLTATICAITGAQPAAVCNDSTITGLQSRIDGSAST